jgi:beta-glucosidase
MSRSARFISSSLTPLMLVVVAGSCGHSDKTIKAYEQSKLGVVNNPDTPVTPVPGGPVAPGVTPPPPPFSGFTCEAANTQQFDSKTMQPYYVSAEVSKKVDDAISAMNHSHKITQMLGVTTIGDYTDIQRSMDVDVPGIGVIRGYYYRDAGRGVNLDQPQANRPRDSKNHSTAFPAPSLRAASWDLEMERQVGVAIGDETVASKNSMLLAPCMNIIRHPYWGRTQETYGEDMYAIGRMATAFTVGIQETVAACAKHFAANNVEAFRSRQDAIMTEQTLREIYGRHFEMVVQDGGVACIMNAYNKVNGVKATNNTHLLRNVLKGPVESGGMGFEGLVLTDWWAMPGDQLGQDAATAGSVAIESLVAGTDIEVPWTLHYSEATLASADPNLVEEAARRVLTQKYRFGAAGINDPWGLKTPSSQLIESSVVSEPHELLSEESAIRSIVLLNNGLGDTPVLPLTDAANIAVVGLDQRFIQISSSVPKSCGVADDGTPQGQTAERDCTFRHAIDPSLGDRGSSRVNADPQRSYGPFKGIQEAAGSGVTVTVGKSAAEAADADTVVVVVGYTPGDEGEEYYIAEKGDRKSLNLPPGQNDLVNSVLDLGKRTIVVIQSGYFVNQPWLNHENKNQATIWAGYPGMRGGLAIGKLIFGQRNFSGKIPMAWATEDMLQPFWEVTEDQDAIPPTTMGYFFGYRDYDKRRFVDKEELRPVYPFGHGLSYSTFTYANVTAPCTAVSKEAIFEVSVDVTNTSEVDGDEVVFLFIKPPPKPAGVTGERPWKELKSFARVSVPAGQTVTAKLPVRVQDLRRWEGGANGKWIIDNGDYTMLIGKNADDAEEAGLSATFTVAD